MQRFLRPAVRVAPLARCFSGMPLTAPPLPIKYVDSDPLEFAIKTEARKLQFDDYRYMRELAFCRIADNPTVGDFKKMTPEERRKMFWGTCDPMFFNQLTFVTCGKPELLYHHGRVEP